MLFVHPTALLLLPLSLLLAAIGWRATSARRGLTAILKILAVACLLLAIAKPLYRIHLHDPLHVTLIDLSPTTDDASINAAVASLKHVRGSQAVIAFSNRVQRLSDPEALSNPALLKELRRQLSETLWPDDPPAGGSALASALQLAGALIPGSDGDVSVYSNGLCTRGDADAEAFRLASRHIAVHATPAAVQPSTPPQTALVRSVRVPPTAAFDQTVNVSTLIEATQTQTVHLSLTVDNRTIDGGDLALHDGLNQSVIPVRMDHVGTTTVRVNLDTGDKSSLVDAAIEVSAAKNVLVVRDPTQPNGTAQSLRTLLGDSAQIDEVDPAALDDPSALNRSAAVVLANLPAAQLSSAAQANLADAVVHDATGLLVTGTERSFGTGGYADSAVLGPLLPVHMPRPAEQLDPSVALVLVIDTSGSMAGNRLDLAKEVARLAISRLTPHDKAGIVEFFGNKRWASPLQTVGDKLEIERDLDRLSAGGGTVLYPAVEEAAFGLRNVAARSRNVLILSDGDVENTPFEQLARQMASDGITVSSGRCGNAKGSGDFLANIAHWGHGRFYEVADRFLLPDITFKQPRTSPLSPIVLAPQALRIGSDPIAQPFGTVPWPSVDHYVRTPARATADVLLSTTSGDPLLTRWRYGSGWVATLPIDLGSAATRPLESASGFRAMVSTLFANIAGDKDPLVIRPTLRPAGLEIDVESTRPDFPGDLPIELTLSKDGVVVRSMQTEAIGGGHWNVLLIGLDSGTYKISATGTSASTTSVRVADGNAAIVVPAPRPLSRLTADTDLLTELEHPPIPITNAVPQVGVDDRFISLWIPLALASLLFFLLHVAARRWPPKRIAKKPISFSAPSDSSPINISRSASQTRQPTLVPTAVVVLTVLLTFTTFGNTWAATTETASDSIEKRIHASLLQSGDISALAREIDSEHAGTPSPQRQVFSDRAAIAWEQGDLSMEIATLGQLNAMGAADADLLSKEAIVAELTGNDSAAEKFWRQSLSVDPENPTANLHLALLLLDQNRNDEADVLLRAAAVSPHHRLAADVIATLYKQNSTAVELLNAKRDTAQRFISTTGPSNEQTDRLTQLLIGEADLELHKYSEASAAFREARRAALLPSDQGYLAEREVAAARGAKTLPDLADHWLAEGDQLQIACIAPLVGVLEETKQTDRLLAWWRALASSKDPTRSGVALSNPIVGEVVGALVDAERNIDATAVSRDVLSRDPQSFALLATAAHVALDLGDAAGADDLLNERLKTIADSNELQRLGNIAFSLGRDVVAENCAKRLESLGDENAVSSLLLQAKLRTRRADVPGVRGLLTQAAKLARDFSQATAVADALDTAGERAEAIELLQRSIAAAPAAEGADELLRQLAWLLEKEDRQAEAITIYRKLWTDADTEAAQAQAQERLLNLAVAGNKLVDLRDASLAKLKAGSGTKADLSLVVDADILTKDVAAAINAVTSSTLIRSEADRLRDLADIYLRTDHFDDAETTLQRLRVADPATAQLTLQRIAEVDLRRGRLDLAREAVDAAASGSDPASSATMLASIFSRSARPSSAAKQYRRAIAASPSSSESSDWLLWAQAMNRAGNRDQAVARLQLLCVDAASSGNDGLLGVAVDGLLNLDAATPSLKPIRRIVALRAALTPDQVLDDHLLSDLSDQLGDAIFGRRALQVSLATSREQRPQTLRILIDAAHASGDVDSATDYGQRLLALSDDFPPSLFLDLGDQLLADGRTAEATRAFMRAVDVTDDDTVRRRAATSLERASQPQAAARLLAPLAARSVGNVALQIELAGLYESAGDLKHAYQDYSDCLDGALKRIAMVAPSDTDDGAAGGRSARPTNRSQQSAVRQGLIAVRIPSPLPEAIKLSLQGALSCAADAPARDVIVQRVLADAVARLNAAALPATNPAGTARSKSPATPPSDLLVSAAALRYASFSAHEPRIADTFDRKLLDTFASDGDLRQTVMDARLFWGLFSNAAALLPQPPTAQAPLLGLWRAIHADPSTQPSDPAELASVLKPPANLNISDWVSLLLPQLLIRDEGQAASQLLATVPNQFDFISTGDATNVLAAAHVLGQQQKIDAIATAWTKALCTAAAIQRAPEAEPPEGLRQSVVARGPISAAPLVKLSALSAAWPIVSPEVRSDLAKRLAAASQTASNQPLADAFAMFVLRSNAGIQLSTSEAAKLCQLAAHNAAEPRAMYFDGGVLAALLRAASPETRKDIAARSLSFARGDEAANWAGQCIADSDTPLDTDVAAMLIAAASSRSDATSQSNKTKLSTERPPWLPWFANASQHSIVSQMCDALVSNVGPPPSSELQIDLMDSPQPSAVSAVPVESSVAAADGECVIGNAERGDSLALAVIERLRVEPPASPEEEINSDARRMSATEDTPQFASHVALIRLAVAALSSSGRAELTQSMHQRLSTTSTSGWDAVVNATLIQALGQRDAALQLLRDCYQHDPHDRVARTALMQRLRIDGRDAECVQLLLAHVYDTGSGDSTLVPDLTSSLQSLGRLSELRKLALSTDDSSMPRGLQLAAVAGDATAATRAFRGIVVRARSVNTGPLSFGFAEPVIGGLLEFEHLQSVTRSGSAPVRVIDVADAGGVQNVLNMFESLSPGDLVLTDALSQMLTHAAASDPLARQLLLSHLKASHEQNAITTNDRILISRLALVPQTNVSDSLLGEMFDATYTLFGSLRTSLAGALATQGDPRSWAVHQWVFGVADVTPPQAIENWSSSGRGSSYFAGTVASTQPNASAEHIADVPRPGDAIADEKESERLIAMIKCGDVPAADRELSDLHSAGRVSIQSFPRTLLVAARIAADQGNSEAFTDRLEDVVNAWQWRGGAPLLDMRLALPGPDEASATSSKPAAVSDAAMSVINRMVDRWPGDVTLCEQLCVIGSWCVQRGDATSAQRLLDSATAESHRLGDGPQQLWIADLASEMGQKERAATIQRSLLEEQRLPPSRIPETLKYYSSLGDSATVDALLSRASSYASFVRPEGSSSAPTTAPVSP